MHQSQPSKIVCKHCGDHSCFEEETQNKEGDLAKSYMCTSCGYTTTTLNKEGSDVVKGYEETTAQIIKDLRWVDDEELVWYPIVLNFPSVGIIFPQGTSKNNWTWVTAPATLIPEEDKEKYPIPGVEGEFYKKKVDMSQQKEFAPHQFYDACKQVGFIISEDLV
jgi:hypothetical protein|tara:strand:- start:54 stop:545 length:492 start_codon:yes stop_codon:yes gene_type:complete